ncbi:MAG: sulfite exporter TauE/SafE family protein [Burkholderiales bacterium]|nr:sulfite exporter TauE/SafE family protein [Burkholderiales bacterium]
MPLSDLPTLGLLALLAFGGSFIFSITGFGSALLTIPLATHLVPLPFALAMYSLLDLTNAWRVGLENPRAAVGAEWKFMLPGIAVGTVIGLTVLVSLPRHAAMVALGVFVLAVALSNLARGVAVGRVHHRWAPVAGAAGGITGALFGAGGPPYAIYLSRRGLTTDQYRATLGVCSVFSISVRVIAFIAAGMLLSLKPWAWALAALPASAAGFWLGSRAFRHLSRDALIRVVGLMLLGSGASLIVRGLA